MPGDLYYGDNLDVLRNKVASESVDLIYLDPPFNSDRTYNLIHKGSQAQQTAFFDTWHWDDKAERAFAELTGHAPPSVRIPDTLSLMMRALKEFLWEDHRGTLAYLAMMGIRVVEMRRVMRATGSLYLHCDPTASHYLKLVLDATFGIPQFQNELIWKRTTAHSSAKRYAPVHDTLLFYSKGPRFTWNQPRSAYAQEYLDKYYRFDDGDGRLYWRADLTAAGVRTGESGKPWKGVDPTEMGRHWALDAAARELVGDVGTLKALDMLDAAGRIYWPPRGTKPQYKRYRDELKGKAVSDIWDDIDRINPVGLERLGYPTQKPLALAQRIIEASSNRGDFVLDPFCGCGTTVEAAEESGRKWIGIDVAIRAIDVIKDRLDDKFQPRVWTEYGEPSDVESAARLADSNPYDFQWWAVRRLGGAPPKGEKKKGGDGGVDGELTLRDFGSDKQRRVVISVKGGRTLTPEMVKSLDTTVRMLKADYGILLTMHSPTSGMKTVARELGALPGSAGLDGRPEHRIRIITVPEILAGTARLPGLNITKRSHSSPPPPEPRKGENLHLPFPAAGSVKRAKSPKKPLAKTKRSEPPAHESAPPRSSKGRR